MMNAKDLMTLIISLEKLIDRVSFNDVKTRKQISYLFDDIRTCVSYRMPMKPVKLDTDGHSFKCPRCGTVFECGDDETVDDFDLCYVCWQLWKDHDLIVGELYNKSWENLDDVSGTKIPVKNGYGRKKKRRK